MSPDANAQQRDYWNGVDSREWVDEADRYDGLLASFTDVLLDAAELHDGDRVLDVGCGNGASSFAAAARVGGGSVTGVDISAPMIGVAEHRAATRGVGNVAFRVGDAQTDPLPGPFDVAISRFGIMFFADPGAAFTNIRAALAPGGRVAFVCWRPIVENEWVRVPTEAALAHVPPPEVVDPDTPGPFRFCAPGSLPAALEAAGFVDAHATPVDAPMLIGGPGSFDEACAFLQSSGMTRRLLGDAPPDVRTRALAAIRESVLPFRVEDGIRMSGAVWVVRARA